MIQKSKSALQRFLLLSALIAVSLFRTGCPPCIPNNLYGPPPCKSDAQCVKARGDGWYCDKKHSYNDGCDEEVDWPVCKKIR